MQILIDQEPANVSLPEGDFSAAVNAVVKHCAEGGRVVTDLEVDGAAYSVDDDSALQAIDRGSVECLSIRTESMEETARRILRSLAEGIPELIDAFAKVNENLQSRDVSAAFDRVEKAGEYWIEIVEACLSTVRALGTDFESVSAPAPGGSGSETISGTEVLTRINNLLAETQTAFENEDNLEIGDIFEYDLPPLLRAFQRILYTLSEKEG